LIEKHSFSYYLLFQILAGIRSNASEQVQDVEAAEDDILNLRQ
jgi:hypothetical protein